MDPEPPNTMNPASFPLYSMVCLCRMVVALHNLVQFYRAQNYQSGEIDSIEFTLMLDTMQHLARLVEFVVQKIHNETTRLTGFHDAADVHRVFLLTVLDFNLLYIEHDLAFATRHNQLPFPPWLIPHCRLVREQDLPTFIAMATWAFGQRMFPTISPDGFGYEDVLETNAICEALVRDRRPIPTRSDMRTVDQQENFEADEAKE